MITRIQQSRKSSSGILDYNEQKVKTGLATPVLVKNTPFDDIPPAISPIASIYGLFEDLETNPARSAMVRTPSFHMTVNPSENDVIDEPRVLEYIQEVMQTLGYGEQPYIVYRHNDIEREHWHVVSTKLRKDGSCVRSGFDAYSLNRLQKELAPKYGFTAGRVDESKAEQHDDILNLDGLGYPVYSQKTRNKRKLLNEIVAVAMQFLFRSMAEFKSILESMNVRLVEFKNKEKSKFYLYGTDGKKRYMSSSFKIDKDVIDAAEAQAKKNSLTPFTESEKSRKMKAVSDFLIDHSTSLQEYISKMNSINLIVTADRDQFDGITNVTIISRKMRTVLNSESGSLDIEKMNRAEATGYWMAPHKGRLSAAEKEARRTRVSEKEKIAIARLINEIDNPQKRPEQKTINIKRK